MPRSVVIYTSIERFSALKSLLHNRFETAAVMPYTLSLPQKANAGGHVRVRATELADGVLAPALDGLVQQGDAIILSSADREVRDIACATLLDDADRFTREAVIQFVSPVIMEFEDFTTPFPVVPLIFRHYVDTWNAFSEPKIKMGSELLHHLRVRDFKISCVEGRWGVGAQGWCALEVEKGRTEEEIRVFNCLVDYAFFCGTGLHTDEGLGQTRRLPAKRDRRG